MTNANGTVASFRVGVAFTTTEVVLSIFGSLELENAAEFGALLDAMIDRGHHRVVLDLADLHYLDDRGLSAVASAVHRLRHSDGTLTLRSPSASVQEIFDRSVLVDLIGLEVVRGDAPRLGPEQTGSAADPGDEIGPSRIVVLPADADVVDGALRLVVNLTKATIDGADGVSVSLLREGRLMTVAASDQTISDMDAGQYATAQGPCLDASLEGRWFHVRSLEDEERWPAFVPVARALGIRSILSSPLLALSRPVGALNIYSRAVGAFGPTEQQLASVFALETSDILSVAGLGVSPDQLEQRLKHALRVREVIAQAQGVLMERADVGESAAFDHLRRFSQRTGRPLREHAEDVVASTRWPKPEADDPIGRQNG